jgi:hypothetical protein
MEERIELIQEVIDRHIYLKGSDREKFIKKVKLLFESYPIACKVIRGTRIINK